MNTTLSNDYKNTEFIEMVINRFEHESNKIDL